MGEYKIECYKGNDLQLKATVTSATGAAVNLTGGILWFTVKTNKTDTDVDAKILKRMTTFTDATHGIHEFTVSNVETAITVGTYYYDLKYKSSDGLITTLFVDEFEVKQYVTIATT